MIIILRVIIITVTIVVVISISSSSSSPPPSSSSYHHQPIPSTSTYIRILYKHTYVRTSCKYVYVCAMCINMELCTCFYCIRTYVVHTYIICTYVHICTYVYTVLPIGKIKIHFDGWTCRYDYWSDVDTLDLHPVGWCERNGWEIQKPGQSNHTHNSCWGSSQW